MCAGQENFQVIPQKAIPLLSFFIMNQTSLIATAGSFVSDKCTIYEQNGVENFDGEIISCEAHKIPVLTIGKLETRESKLLPVEQIFTPAKFGEVNFSETLNPRCCKDYFVPCDLKTGQILERGFHHHMINYDRKRNLEDPPHEDPPDTSLSPKKHKKGAGKWIEIPSFNALIAPLHSEILMMSECTLLSTTLEASTPSGL